MKNVKSQIIKDDILATETAEFNYQKQFGINFLELSELEAELRAYKKILSTRKIEFVLGKKEPQSEEKQYYLSKGL
jgi:hypothetical protein